MLAAAVGAIGVGDARAARRVDLRCRDRIAQNLLGEAEAGLRHIDTCHQTPRRSGAQAACNDLTNVPAFTRAQARAQGIIIALCPAKSPVLQNYPIQASDVATVVSPSIRKRLEDSANGLEALPSLATDRRVARAQRRCVDAIGSARTAVVDRVVHDAIRCQEKLDRTATVLGSISSGCLVDAPSRTVARATHRVMRGCGTLRGADVGSCDPLPGCVLTSAVATAHALARDIFGALPNERGLLCGNGVIDVGEQCDDGNENDHDACTNKCLKASCGDGITETGVEECDDGNNNETDACTPHCKKARCGDGIVETGVEECDDGNDVPGDGCTDCHFDEVACPPAGLLDMVLTLVPSKDGSTAQNVAGMKLQATYPTSVSIPGSGPLPVGDPSDPATRVVLLSDAFYNGLVVFNDTDAALQTTLALSAPLQLQESVPLERARFDCTPATKFTPTDFVCTILQEADALGAKIEQSAFPACQVQVMPGG
jgi:cysteine-rich repeat protein